jgi:hypothetical protein
MAEDIYAETVQLLRDIATNQRAVDRAMFAGRPVDLNDPIEVLAEAAVEPEEFRRLAATGRQIEDTALRALSALADRNPRRAQEAVDEAGGDRLWILLRALETVPTEGG